MLFCFFEEKYVAGNRITRNQTKDNKKNGAYHVKNTEKSNFIIFFLQFIGDFYGLKLFQLLKSILFDPFFQQKSAQKTIAISSDAHIKSLHCTALAQYRYVKIGQPAHFVSFFR